MVMSGGPQGSGGRKHEGIWRSVFWAMRTESTKPRGEAGLAWGVPEECRGHHDQRVVREVAGSNPVKV